MNESCTGKRENKNFNIYSHIHFFKNRSLFSKCEPKNAYILKSINLVYAIHRLAVTDPGALYSCVRLYNKLPDAIKRLPNSKLFKRHIHECLINLEPYTVNIQCEHYSL